jgi:hypothetical protein
MIPAAYQTKHTKQTLQTDFQRCEVAMLDQSVKKLKRHLLANDVLLRGCEKEDP